jgi:uncharacterized protein DUF5655
VSRWRCPACDREFGRAHQSHVCVPGNTVDETFAGRPAGQRDIYETIVGYLNTLGPLHIDAVKVGVFLYHERKLAEVRPMARSLRLLLVLPYGVDTGRVVRRERLSTERVLHYIKLTDPSDVDSELRDWLADAYELAG